MRQEECHYHWGKYLNGRQESWTCCGQAEFSVGCTVADNHVWSGVHHGVNGPFLNFKRAKSCLSVPGRVINPGVYSLDCEMCYTKNGLELVKITVLDISGNLVFESFVKPEARIIDYNTRFSGITKKDLSSIKTTLKEVQYELLQFIYAETILIGHGLENDLRVLKIIHPKVIDTAMIFPHEWGLPYRRSLRSLARIYLRRFIQMDYHDSAEDARSAGDLILLKLACDYTQVELYYDYHYPIYRY